MLGKATLDDETLAVLVDESPPKATSDDATVPDATAGSRLSDDLAICSIPTESDDQVDDQMDDQLNDFETSWNQLKFEGIS